MSEEKISIRNPEYKTLLDRKARLPTFDEWYEAKHGHAWESNNNGKLIHLVMLDLSRHMREYITEMARAVG